MLNNNKAKLNVSVISLGLYDIKFLLIVTNFKMCFPEHIAPQEFIINLQLRRDRSRRFGSLYPDLLSALTFHDALL